MASMTSPKLRLGLAIAVFGLWMGWLIHLALTASRPIVLSRPQFFVSNLVVVAHIEQLKGEVQLKEVLWPKSDEQKWLDKKVTISNLHDCEDGWAGLGDYILPLMADPKGGLQVAPIPRSPGSPPLKESKDGQRAFL